LFEYRNSTTEDTESTEFIMEKDPFTGRVIGLAIDVHRVLGPRLLESTLCELCALRGEPETPPNFSLQ